MPRLHGDAVPEDHAVGTFANTGLPPRLPSGVLSGFGGLLPSPDWQAFPQHVNPPSPPVWYHGSQPIDAPPLSAANHCPASSLHGAPLYPASPSREGASLPQFVLYVTSLPLSTAAS